MLAKKLTKSDVVGTNVNLGFWCYPAGSDGGYCPGWFLAFTPGTFNGYVYGTATDAIYYDSVGINPQQGGYSDSTTWDYYDLYQWVSGAWVSQVHSVVHRGHAFRATYVGTPATFMGAITGNLVQYGDGYRLPFPHLKLTSTWPNWVACDFCNDIEGMSHENLLFSAGWFFSRTEFSVGGVSQFSVVGWVPFSTNLSDSDAWPYQSGGVNDYDEPQAWRNLGFLHYGDIATDHSHFRLFVSINAPDNTQAGVGVF